MVEKPGTVNNIKYRVGDDIEIKTISGEKIYGEINQLIDTAIVINFILVKYKEIAAIYNRRVINSMFSAAGLLGGSGYICIDAFNNLINNETTIFRKSTLKTGAIMFSIGAVLKLFTKRKRSINNEDWRIKVLDFSIINDPGVYGKPAER